MPPTMIRVLVWSCALPLAAGLGAQQPAGPAPPPPPGTEKVLSHAVHGDRTAACALKAGPGIEHGGRRVPPTEVWLTDGRAVWKTSIAGACDPAWSPDGSRLAVTAPDGLWVLAGDQQATGTRLASTDPPADAATAAVTFSRPGWSLDGSLIAVLAADDGGSRVHVYDVSSAAKVFESSAGATAFEWATGERRRLRIDGKIFDIPR